jgi:heterodisulfide reductase subunit D
VTVNNPLDAYAEEIIRCNKCGFCLATCPVYDVLRDEAIAPRGLLRLVRAVYDGQLSPSDDYAQRIFSCSLCGVCTPTCPSGVEVDGILQAAREDLGARGMLPPVLHEMGRRVQASHHLVEEATEAPLAWAEGFSRPPRGSASRAELVYFVGCVASAFPAVHSIPQSLVQVLERAGQRYSLLAAEEWCCGYPLLANGQRDAARELMAHNVEAVRSIGAERVVCTCASCYHTWAHVYPQEVGDLGFEVIHAAQLLADLLAEGKLVMQRLSRQVTTHDPCELGRKSGIYDAPREVLAAIPDLTQVEMALNQANAFCCGEGGNLEVFDPELSEAVARRRLAQAQATGAQVLVTACARNKQTLASAASRHDAPLEVLDIVEVVERATREEDA